MAAPKPAPRTADGQPLPSKLKLAFSKAADNSRISRVFDPAVKSKIDPKNYVVKRDKATFDSTIAGGRAAFLYDTATGAVQTLSMAYHVHDKTSGEHKHTEIGTSITTLAGFKSAQVIVAALTLREWWEHEPSGLIVTEILPDNAPSLGVYRDKMGWQLVSDEATRDELFTLCNEIIAPEDQGRDALWLCCSASVLPKMAQILLDYLDSGALENKRSGDKIALDLSALEEIGLTRRNLRAIARGITDKSQLTRPGPKPPNPVYFP